MNVSKENCDIDYQEGDDELRPPNKDVLQRQNRFKLLSVKMAVARRFSISYIDDFQHRRAGLRSSGLRS